MVSVRVTPIDGWGYMETLDGNLADPFTVRIDESAVDIGSGILGWRGLVDDDTAKYAGMPFEMSPRHTPWSGTVVINIKSGQTYAFSGMADTTGLECDWL